MRKFLERLPIYRIFLWIRPRFISDERLRSRLARRGHNLDKVLAEGGDTRLFLFELKVLFGEYFRRGLEANSVTQWAWQLVYRAELGLTGPEEVAAPRRDLKSGPFDVEEAIESRRSVRQWETQAVTRTDILAALRVARWAPSSCNRQVWKFLILDGQEDKEKLTPFTHQSFFKAAPVVIVPLIDLDDYHKDIKHFADLDSGAVIQTLLLALHAKGLGACWIGINRDDHFGDRVRQFRARFDVPENLTPVSLIPVGYYSKMPAVPPRKDAEELLIDRTT